jgi:hypothetical protein
MALLIAALACAGIVRPAYAGAAPPAWSIVVKPVGVPVPIYSAFDGPAKTRDYEVRNTTSKTLLVTRVVAGCDCIAPSVPLHGEGGKPQRLPMVLEPGEAMRLSVLLHLNHLSIGYLDEVVQVIGRTLPAANESTNGDEGVLGAFYVRARMESPVSVSVRFDGEGSVRPVASGQLPLNVDLGNISPPSPGERRKVVTVSLTADPHLLPPDDLRKSIKLEGGAAHFQIARVEDTRAHDGHRRVLRFALSINSDARQSSFRETLDVRPEIVGNDEDRGLRRWAAASRNALGRVSLAVSGRVVGDIRADPEAVTLGLYVRAGAVMTASGRLDALDPAVGTIYLIPRDAAVLRGAQIQADNRLVIAYLIPADQQKPTDGNPWRDASMLRVQVAPDVVRSYRRNGRVPVPALLAPNPLAPRMEAAETGAVRYLHTSVRIVSERSPAVVIPVTIMIAQFQK